MYPTKIQLEARKATLSEMGNALEAQRQDINKKLMDIETELIAINQLLRLA